MPQSTRRVALEVCIASVDDALTASEAGADRLELNSALSLGGLTPSLGLLKEARAAVKTPIIAMIRPRPGGFAYSPADLRVMRADLDACLSAGVDGVTFGFLHDDGTVDADRCREFLAAIPPGVEAVFHRAFDVTPDPFAAMEVLISLGFRRILTSGQEESAYAGSALLAELIRLSAGRIEILPAGGINRFTVRDVVERTGCDQVHASLRAVRTDRSTLARPSIGFGASIRSPEDRYDATSSERVAEVLERLVG